MKKIAIIGFGAAGYNAAKEVRGCDPKAVIDVYSDTDLAPYNPMLTTYFVKGAIPYEAMFPYGSLESIEKELDLTVYRNTPVAGLNAGEKKIKLPDGSEKAYDQILITTGASAVMPPLKGIDLPGVLKMRTVEDSLKLKELLDAGKVRSGLVIGASWVGIKVVEDLVTANVPCTLVDGAPWMFYVAAFEDTAKRIQADLEGKGVSVSCGQMLSHIEEAEDGQITAVMQSGDRFTADVIAVCIGVRMNVGFLRDSGLQMNRGIVVDEHMRTNCEGIYAAGDCCEALDIQSGTHRNIGIWYNAVKQGQVAGANMAGKHMEFDANILSNLGHYLNYDFISIGDVSICKAEDDVLYEYEDAKYYIRAVKGADGAIKCINIIGSGLSNGVIKNYFIKAIENKDAKLNMKTVCFLQEKGFPNSFINFLGGISVD